MSATFLKSWTEQYYGMKGGVASSGPCRVCRVKSVSLQGQSAACQKLQVFGRLRRWMNFFSEYATIQVTLVVYIR